MTANQTAAWPEGVIARYLTVAGEALQDPSIAVDVAEENSDDPVKEGFRATCRGCGEGDLYTYNRTVEMLGRQYVSNADGERLARKSAQAHAETCRSLPRPVGSAS